MPPGETAPQDEMGTESVGRLLLRYSAPSVASMIATSLYNVVDRVFIGRSIGDSALAGLALTLPVMNLAAAFGSMVGVGAGALASLRLGEGRRDQVERILASTLLSSLALGTLFSIAAFLCLDPLLRLFGASRATLPHARQFLEVILLGTPPMHLFLGLNNLVRSTGHPRKAMLTIVSTVGLNTLLAPLFLFAFGWGLRGAALATVIAQVAGLAISLRHFLDPRRTVRLRRKHLAPDPAMAARILGAGMSTFCMQTAASLVAAVVNLQLVRHGGDLAVAAFGIVSGILLTITMTGMGIAQGMQPIVGFNYGAERFERAFHALRNAVVCVTAINFAGFLVGRFAPHLVVGAFSNDGELRNTAAEAMRIATTGLPVMGFQMLTAHFFLSIGRTRLSVATTLARQVGILIPYLILLPELFGLTGVWMAIPASDFTAALVNASIFRYERKRILRHGSTANRILPLRSQ